ncbi:MAG: TonB-dependent receptor plug domain-containing protein, partial [Longimicrobiales bacterium]
MEQSAGCGKRSGLLVALSAVWLLVPAAAAAQATGSVRGRVVEESSQRPLAGVQISVQGTGRGGLTRPDGEYLIQDVPVGAQTVRADIIGYRTMEQAVTVAAAAIATADFVLAPQAIDLGELVVTGTPGAVTRRTLGNSITKIDAAEVADRTTISSVAELLTARAPGVQILANSGTPGAAVDIRVRGAGSFIGNQPVVFIDGVRVNTDDLGSFGASGAGLTSYASQATSAFDLINPQDIESIEVIKGPAAATLYGAEAAGGVIQIITKRGTLGSRPLRFDVRMEQGLNEWEIDIPQNFTVCTQTKLGEEDEAGDPIWPGCQGLAPGSLLTDNPMRRDPDALRTGGVQRITVSGRGGGENISYYVAATRDREQGVFNNSFNNRVSLRANFSATPNDKIDFNVSSAYVRGDLRLPLGDESAQAMLLSASRGRPGRVPPAGDSARDGWYTVNADMANAYDNTTRSDRFT